MKHEIRVDSSRYWSLISSKLKLWSPDMKASGTFHQFGNSALCLHILQFNDEKNLKIQKNEKVNTFRVHFGYLHLMATNYVSVLVENSKFQGPRIVISSSWRAISSGARPNYGTRLIHKRKLSVKKFGGVPYSLPDYTHGIRFRITLVTVPTTI